MKIYQIHEYGGEYPEDRYDYIVASYLSRAKAEKRLCELRNEEEDLANQYEMCNVCPLFGRHKMRKNDYETLRMTCKKYEKFEEIKHGNPEEYYDERCVNVIEYYESSFFNLEEVDVIE